MARLQHRARLKNRLTGESQEIILVNPALLAGEYEDRSRWTKLFNKYLASQDNSGLIYDLTKALSKFSAIERRVLFRVLVQGQSIETATVRMTASSKRWRLWLTNKALPRLRRDLAIYFQNGKIVL